jgi:hypothetical protein
MDEKKLFVITPPPATLSLSALAGTEWTLKKLVDALRAAGIKVELTPELQAKYDQEVTGNA